MRRLVRCALNLAQHRPQHGRWDALHLRKPGVLIERELQRVNLENVAS